MHYKRIGYNLNVMRQSANVVFNPITVNNHSSLFNCTSVVSKAGLWFCMHQFLVIAYCLLYVLNVPFPGHRFSFTFSFLVFSYFSPPGQVQLRHFSDHSLGKIELLTRFYHTFSLTDIIRITSASHIDGGTQYLR